MSFFTGICRKSRQGRAWNESRWAQSGDRLCRGCEAAEGVEIEGMEDVVERGCDVRLRSRELGAREDGRGERVV